MYTVPHDRSTRVAWAGTMVTFPCPPDTEINKQYFRTASTVVSRRVISEIQEGKNFPIIKGGSLYSIFGSYTTFDWGHISKRLDFQLKEEAKFEFGKFQLTEDCDLTKACVTVSPAILNLFYHDGPVVDESSEHDNEISLQHGGFTTVQANGRKYDAAKAEPILRHLKTGEGNQSQAAGGLGSYHLLAYASEERGQSLSAGQVKMKDTFSPIRESVSIGQVARNYTLDDAAKTWELLVSCLL